MSDSGSADKWLQLSLLADRYTPEELENALWAVGAQAVTLSDAADTPVLEPLPGETPLWQATWVTGLFSATEDNLSVQQHLAVLLDDSVLRQCRLQRLADRDWTRAWLDNFHPMQFSEKLWICPSTEEPPQVDAVNIILDPGLAFGTGTHPTTALCLSWLDSIDLTGKNIIDYGCGSGILAIAALKLGAEQAWAVDIDPQALTASQENAERNGVERRLITVLPHDLAVPRVDVLVANILARPLIDLAPKLAELVNGNGRLALSGLLAEQADAVMAAYLPWFEFATAQQQDKWVLLTGVRK